jgi:hypothetical protein
MFDSSFSDMEVTSLVSSSSTEPWACDWWYFSPLICLYFFEQLGSGHSSSTGEGGGLPQGVGVLGTGGVGGGTTILVFFPWTLGWGESSSPARLFRLLLGSGRGGTKGVGDEGAVEGPEPFAAPRRPFTPPFRNLLCTDERVSRPFGVRLSRSLVGESQNLGGAQSWRVQSSKVPT